MNDVSVIKKIVHESHVARYKFCQKLVKDKVILDAACGFGGGTLLLAETARRVTGVDFDESLLDYARRYCKKDNIDYLKCDVIKLPLPDDYFEAVVSLETIEHLAGENQVKFLEELQRVTVDGGTVVISTPEKTIWRWMAIKQVDHISELTKKELNELLSRFFLPLAYYGQEKTRKLPPLRKGIRLILNFLKQIDFLRLRHKILPKVIRQMIDKKTSPVNLNHWTLEKLDNNELAAQITVVCRNLKKKNEN